MRRFALVLEYDGAAFAGSQMQADAPTVQGEVERALARLTYGPVRIALAGRTDAGVHATGQVAAFSTEARHSPETWTRALNALLPADVAVRRTVQVPETFDPRRDARWRLYRYSILNAAERSPTRRGTGWHVRGALVVEAMAAEAAALIGTHDVASFGGSPGPGRSTIRKIRRAGVERQGAQVWFTVEGSAFLPHQVRRTVGALVQIGQRRLPAGTFSRWLARPEPGVAGPTAPAHGLTLVRIVYPGLPELSVDADADVNGNGDEDALADGAGHFGDRVETPRDDSRRREPEALDQMRDCNENV